MSLAWKIWYGDGKTFSSADGSWVDAPGELVVCVTYSEIATVKTWTRRILNSMDVYVWVPGDAYPIGTDDLYAQLLRMKVEPPSPWPSPPVLRERLEDLDVRRFVKFGALVGEQEWSDILCAAGDDKDFDVGTTPGRRAEDLVT